MSKFILIILSMIAVALIVTGIVLETVPIEQLQSTKTTDPISCSDGYAGKYTLITKGLITEVNYKQYFNSAGNLLRTDVVFFVDGELMTLDFGKTRSSGGSYGFYSEIYGADANGNIENNKYYYIYKYGDRIIWSQTPK